MSGPWKTRDGVSVGAGDEVWSAVWKGDVPVGFERHALGSDASMTAEDSFVSLAAGKAWAIGEIEGQKRAVAETYRMRTARCDAAMGKIREIEADA